MDGWAVGVVRGQGRFAVFMLCQRLDSFLLVSDSIRHSTHHLPRPPAHQAWSTLSCGWATPRWPAWRGATNRRRCCRWWGCLLGWRGLPVSRTVLVERERHLQWLP